MKFKFGVDSFIWAEDFKEKDLWIIEKAKEIGFEVVDFANRKSIYISNGAGKS